MPLFCLFIRWNWQHLLIIVLSLLSYGNQARMKGLPILWITALIWQFLSFKREFSHWMLHTSEWNQCTSSFQSSPLPTSTHPPFFFIPFSMRYCCSFLRSYYQPISLLKFFRINSFCVRTNYRDHSSTFPYSDENDPSR